MCPALLHRPQGWGCHQRARQTYARLHAAVRGSLPTAPTGEVIDYYELLGVDDDASIDTIKTAYRQLAKHCHPDYLGDEGHDACVMLNEAYTVLSDWQQREAYNACLQQHLTDALDDYTGKPLSKWLVGHALGKADDPAERRAVFVDEITCIGCKQCVWCASATFRMEPEYGRSRVFAQWIDSEPKIQESIDACPVECIHWVSREQLPALEYMMQKRMGRTNVSVMMSGASGGRGAGNVFDAAERFVKEREQREERRREAARYTAAQEDARRRAAAAVAAASGGGWWAGVAGAVSGAWGDALHAARGRALGADGAVGVEVGRRRRARRAPDATGATIPLERSLVPVSMYAEGRRDTRAD
ncbi:hypothetical protein WJX81_001095 [Elliptochloris bilobata]|uniref:J domain-containing protein n=1 Tax=Elliptochloris bilobata TaxID=381761 RepID=A0AAW1RVI4_9CHLO